MNKEQDIKFIRKWIEKKEKRKKQIIWCIKCIIVLSYTLVWILIPIWLIASDNIQKLIGFMQMLGFLVYIVGGGLLGIFLLGIFFYFLGTNNDKP